MSCLNNPAHAPINRNSSDYAEICRVAIVGAQRQRVARVASLLHCDESFSRVDLSASADERGCSSLEFRPSVKVEYLPCVATFDSYEDENGVSVRYLAKLEYHGPLGKLIEGKSLAPYFDNNVSCEKECVSEENRDRNLWSNDNPFPGITAVAIGCGIYSEDDMEKIKQFVLSFSQGSDLATINDLGTANDSDRIYVDCIKPNPEYASMKEENDAYRGFNDQEKKEAILNGTIGPGKMANFVYNMTASIVRQIAIKEPLDNQLGESYVNKQSHNQSASPRTSKQLESIPSQFFPPALHTADPERTRFACRRCRSVLFGEDDLEDPPHTQSLHNFQKKGVAKATARGNSWENTRTPLKCSSYFLSQPLPWMNELIGIEGKIHCPKCQFKMGHYSWTGAQCSCGTWVTPAIFFPISKVDEVRPISENVLAACGALIANPVGLYTHDDSNA